MKCKILLLVFNKSVHIDYAQEKNNWNDIGF